MKRLLLILLSIILLISCTSTSGVYITDDTKVPLLDVSCFGAPFEMYQLMEGNVFGDDEYSIEAYSIFDGQELDIILLAPTGLTVAEITYDGEKTSADSQFFSNGDIVASYIIFDFQLCYGNYDALSELLSGYDFQFSENEEDGRSIRTVSRNDELIYEITITDSIITVNNLLRRYSYSMEEL